MLEPPDNSHGLAALVRFVIGGTDQHPGLRPPDVPI